MTDHERGIYKASIKHLENEVKRLKKDLGGVITAWEKLDAGHYTGARIARWLKDDMQPAMNKARGME